MTATPAETLAALMERAGKLDAEIERLTGILTRLREKRGKLAAAIVTLSVVVDAGAPAIRGTSDLAREYVAGLAAGDEVTVAALVEYASTRGWVSAATSRDVAMKTVLYRLEASGELVKVRRGVFVKSPAADHAPLGRAVRPGTASRNGAAPISRPVEAN
jgi:hypothetical protein